MRHNFCTEPFTFGVNIGTLTKVFAQETVLHRRAWNISNPYLADRHHHDYGKQ